MSEAFLSSLLDELKALKAENSRLKEKIISLESSNNANANNNNNSKSSKSISDNVNKEDNTDSNSNIDSNIGVATEMIIRYVKAMNL